MVEAQVRVSYAGIALSVHLVHNVALNKSQCPRRVSFLLLLASAYNHAV